MKYIDIVNPDVVQPLYNVYDIEYETSGLKDHITKNKEKKVEYIIAGPSCDSHDILYQKKLYTLPKNIKVGDRLRIFSAGSYIISYQSEFNGIKKIKEIFLK